jgi:glycosyltransferase involved in cell wall biosynthesis
VKVIIATGRQAHYQLPANAFARRGCDVRLYTATPRSRMRNFVPAVTNRWIPAPVAIFSGLTHLRTPLFLDEIDSTLFDHWCAKVLEPCNLVLGASTSSLATCKAAQRLGATFVLDRACPDIRVQQNVMAEEAQKVGGEFRRNSPWFIERQVEEYETADFILSPSDYSRRSFPDHLRKKVVLAPLYGRSKVSPRLARSLGSTFVLGCVGGQPLRKGYLYLLQAWKELALPNAKLKIRTGDAIFRYPLLKQLMSELPNVELISYVPDISTFYAECDAFILPSVDDGFGMALFEAVANGVPAVATRNCGASELLVAERDCLLIDAFSVEQIKEAVLRLYESNDLREKLSRSGPVAVEALQEGGLPRPYEDGVDSLLAQIKATRTLQSVAYAL